MVPSINQCPKQISLKRWLLTLGLGSVSSCFTQKGEGEGPSFLYHCSFGLSIVYPKGPKVKTHLPLKTACICWQYRLVICLALDAKVVFRPPESSSAQGFFPLGSFCLSHHICPGGITWVFFFIIIVKNASRCLWCDLALYGHKPIDWRQSYRVDKLPVYCQDIKTNSQMHSR